MDAGTPQTTQEPLYLLPPEFRYVYVPLRYRTANIIWNRTDFLDDLDIKKNIKSSQVLKRKMKKLKEEFFENDDDHFEYYEDYDKNLVCVISIYDKRPETTQRKINKGWELYKPLYCDECNTFVIKTSRK